MESTNQMTNGTQQPTKRDLRFQKQQEEQSARLRQIRSKKIKKMAIFIIPVLIIAGAVAFWAIKSSDTSGNQSSDPKMEISASEYDFGTISMAAGTIKKTFEIKNTGASDLKIENIMTSCHCTGASLKVGDKKSPTFGMNGSAFWSQKIAPGETAELEAIFDPAYHGPAGTGAATREIYFTTNDPGNKDAKVTLNAKVTP